MRCAMLISAIGLLVLTASAHAQLDVADVPTFSLRGRVVSVGGDAPGEQATFRFALGGATPQVATGQAFSDWLTIDRAVLEPIVTQYPNSYLKRYPVSMGVSVGSVVDPTHVELEVRLDENDQVVPLRAELWGGKLGLLVWREDGEPHAGTMADYNRKYWQPLQDVHIPPDERAQHFPIIDRFIGGDSDRTSWREGIEELSRAGFNAIMLPPDPRVRDLLLETGQQRTAWAIYNPPGYAFDYSDEITVESINAWAQKLADPFVKAGYAPTDMAAYAISDEPGWYYPAMLNTLAESPEGMARFHAYLKEQGLTLTNMGADNWDNVKPIGASAVKDLRTKRLYYWTMRFFPWDSSRHFADATRAMERAFYDGVPALVNWNFFAGRFYVPGPVANNGDKQSPDAAMGGHDWHEFGRMRGCNMLWTEDWFGDATAYQWTYYCSRLRVAAHLGNVEFGGYVIPRTAGGRENGVLQKILTIAGSEGKALKYFVFGPEYTFPGNCYSFKSHVLVKMAEAHHMIGLSEDVLWPGRMPPSQVAILHPRSSQPWDVMEVAGQRPIMDATNTNLNARTTDYLAETFNLYLALQHANIPTDVIDEDMLNADDLAAYKVLYVTGPNIPKEGQKAIVRWVEAGGTVVTVTGAGHYDRYNEPCDVMPLAGMPHQRMLINNTDALAESGRVVLGDSEIAVYGPRGKLTNAADTAPSFTDGQQAVHQQSIGSGHAVHFTFMPGISYWRSRTGTEDGLPVGFSDDLRELIVQPIRNANVMQPVEVDVPMVEAPILASDAGAAVTLLNWTGKPIDQLTVRIRPGFDVEAVSSVKKQHLVPRHIEGGVEITLPLDAADILLLRPLKR